MNALSAPNPLTIGQDQRPVLADAKLKPGFAREALSRVADASWDLAPAVFRENVRRSHATVHFSSLLAWSLRYIEVFSPDILAARRELIDLQARRDRLIAEDTHFSLPERRARRIELLEEVLADRRRVGRGVPVWTDRNAAPCSDPTIAVTQPVNFYLLHL